MKFPGTFLHDSLVELITQTSTNLPPDVRAAMTATGLAEKPDTQASQVRPTSFFEYRYGGG